jgi:hypothetical protein
MEAEIDYELPSNSSYTLKRYLNGWRRLGICIISFWMALVQPTASRCYI